jgi:hypothetical protein
VSARAAGAAVRARHEPARRRPAPPPARPRPREAPRPRPRSAPRPQARARARTRLRMGPLIIPLIALLLGGIVWVNVAKLSLTDQTGTAIERSRSIEGETARLASTLQSHEGSIRRNAEKRLGMVAPPDDGVTYLTPPKAKAP